MQDYHLTNNEEFSYSLLPSYLYVLLTGYFGKNPNHLLIHYVEVNNYIRCWTLKLRCTQYEFFRTMQPSRMQGQLSFEVGQDIQHFSKKNKILGGLKVVDHNHIVLSYHETHHPKSSLGGALPSPIKHVSFSTSKVDLNWVTPTS